MKFNFNKTLNNFNKTPATIIEPDTGASTWALGSHKWSKNIDIFTKNASINLKYKKILITSKPLTKNKFKLFWVLKIFINPINKGNEAKRV